MTGAGRDPRGRRFSISCDGDGRRRRLALSGELDLAGAEDLEAELARLCAQGPSEVELDLHEVDFIDSTGIRSILLAKEICTRRGIGFLLVPAREEPQRRIFERAGLLDLLPWRTSG